jgi:eukaryotic-like serine/threonine-protein kinase
MTLGRSSATGRDSQFNQALVEYLEAEEAGCAPDPLELFARHPELARELKEFLDNRAALGALAASDTSPTSPQPVAEPANRVGDYDLLGEIARGGMGVVYRARQISANREVALKMMLAGARAPAAALRRFRIEAEAAANLDHPNIVPIYDVGMLDGQPYFTMKLIEGGSLAARLGEFCLTGAGSVRTRAQRIAGLLAAVARAVHHAHQHGILHRDLKPANILLAGDVPMVTDFGLAKRTQSSGELTQTETILGTAAYMAPEQAEPARGGLTTAADVYSLGSIFYELLTGRPPFVGASFMDTLLMLVQQHPVPPRQRSPRIPADLELICLKCLAKQPGDRYGTALELADDLERWRAGDPISLRPPGLLERGWRSARRNRLAALLLTTVAALMALVTIGSLVAAWHIAEARDAADRSAAEATAQALAASTARDSALEARNVALAALAEREKALVANRRLLVTGYVATGTRALDSGDPLGALVWYGEALRLDAAGGNSEDGHRVRLAGVLQRCPRMVQVWFDNELPPAFSADGRRVALLRKNTARVWRVDNGAAASPPLKHKDDVRRAMFSPDGSRLLTVTAGGDALLWDLGAKSVGSLMLKHGATVTFAAFNADGSRVVTAGIDHSARVWRTTDGAAAAGPFKQTTPIVFASFSREGTRLVTSGGEPAKSGAVHVWDLAPTKNPRHLAFKTPLVIRLAYFTPDGKQIVTVGGKRVARLVDPATGKEAAAVHGVRANEEGSVAPDGAHVLKLDGSVARIVELASGQAVAAPLIHGGEVYHAAFSADGRSIVTVARDRGARVWDAATGHALTPLLRHPRMISKASFSGDGRLLLTLAEDGIVRVWQLAPREPLQPLAQLAPKTPAVYSPDGRSIAVVDKDGAVRLRDTATGKETGGPWKLSGPVTHLAFAPDGQSLLLAADRSAQVWDVTHNAARTPVLSHVGGVQRALFTPDGSRAVIHGARDVLQVWDATSGALQSSKARPALGMLWRELVLTPDGTAAVVVRPAHVAEVFDVVSGESRGGPFKHAAVVTQAAFSPDGKRLVVGSADGDAHLWDIASGHPAAPPLQHGAPLRLLVFSADGRRLATIAEDHTVRAWDLATGLPISPVLAQNEPIVRATLSADGRRLCLVGKSGAGRVWDLAPDERSVHDLLRLSEWLSGQTLNHDTGGLEPAAMLNLRVNWPALRARYPHEFRLAMP